MTEQEKLSADKPVAAEKSTTDESFQDLRIRLESDFRKKVFGGIDPQDVVKYVQSIREQSQEVHTVYEGRMNDLEETNKQLRRDQERYEEKIRLSAENIEDKQITISELEAEKAAMQWKLAEIRREMADTAAAAEYAVKNQQIQLNNEALDLFSQEKSVLAERINALQDQLEEKNQSVDAVTARLEAQRNALSAKENQLAELEGKLASYAGDLAASQQLAEMYLQECGGLEQRLNEDKNQADRLLAEKTALDNLLQDREQRLYDLESRLTSVAEVCEGLRSERKNDEEKILRLQMENEELTVFGLEKVELENQIRNLQRQIAEKNQADTLSASQLAAEQQAAAEKEQMRIGLEREIDNIKSQLASSQQLNDLYLQERSALEHRLSSKSMEADRMFAENGELNHRVNEAKIQIDGMQHKLGFLYEQLKAKEQTEQQLEIERQRANQAERKITTMSEWVVRLKDRFQNNASYFDNRLKELEDKQYENSRKSAAEIMREASQAAESIMATAQRNAEALIEGANHKTQDLTAAYGSFKSDVMSFRSNLQDFQMNAGADMEIIYSTIKKPERLMPEDQFEDDDKSDRRSNLLAFNKIG